MDNLARKEYLDREIAPFMREIAMVSDLKALSEACHEFLYLFPPQRGLEIAAALTFANPFFMADIPAENARSLDVSLDLFSEIIMRAKLTASRSTQTNVLVACTPTAAADTFQDAMRAGLGLSPASLYTAAFSASSASALGANLCEQELDELSLIRNGLNRNGYVAQQHMRCSPYVARLLSFYNIRPILVHRDIADTLVDLDDALMQRPEIELSADALYFRDGLPANFKRLDRADRLMLLAQRQTSWLVQFYVSWKKSERLGLVAPLWLSHDELRGDKGVLARRITDFLGVDGSQAIRLAHVLEDKSVASVQVGARDVPSAVRDYIASVARFYREDEDLTPLLSQ